MKCLFCNKEYEDNLKNCPYCDFPKTGTKEMMLDYLSKREKNISTIYKSDQKNITVTVLLFVIAILTIIQTVITYLHPQAPDFILITNIFLSVIFLLAAFFVSKKPLFITLFSLILFLLIILTNYLLNPETIYEGIIFNLVIVGILASAVVFSIKSIKSKKELKTKDKW